MCNRVVKSAEIGPAAIALGSLSIQNRPIIHATEVWQFDVAERQARKSSPTITPGPCAGRFHFVALKICATALRAT